jgi:hypothetical protein
MMMLTASVCSLFHNNINPFRAQDVLFGGIIFNLAFAFSLAFAPKNTKNLKEKQQRFGTKPKLSHFLYPIAFSLGGGLALFTIFAVTASYSCSLISLAILLFLYAGSLGGRGSIFKKRRFGNRTLYICGACVFALTALITSTPVGKIFDYTRPDVKNLTVAIVVAVAFYVLAETAKYFLSTEGREKLKKLRNKATLEDEDIDEETFDDEDVTILADDPEDDPENELGDDPDETEEVESLSDEEIESIDGMLTIDEENEEITIVLTGWGSGTYDVSLSIPQIDFIGLPHRKK